MYQPNQIIITHDDLLVITGIVIAFYSMIVLLSIAGCCYMCVHWYRQRQA
jgi:hypothetical protein